MGFARNRIDRLWLQSLGTLNGFADKGLVRWMTPGLYMVGSMSHDHCIQVQQSW